MVYLGVFIGIGLMAAMIYMAVNKKSSSAVRIASLAALALMILTIIICLFIVLTDNRVPVDESVVIVGAVPETKERSTASVMALMILVILLAGLFALVFFFSMREQHKNFPKTGL